MVPGVLKGLGSKLFFYLIGTQKSAHGIMPTATVRGNGAKQTAHVGM